MARSDTIIVPVAKIFTSIAFRAELVFDDALGKYVIRSWGQLREFYDIYAGINLRTVTVHFIDPQGIDNIVTCVTATDPASGRAGYFWADVVPAAGSVYPTPGDWSCYAEWLGDETHEGCE